MTCAIIAHTRCEDALDVLAQDLARMQSDDPLAVHTLLVQGGAVGRWIATELAQRSVAGVSAGLDIRPVGSFCRALVAPGSGHDPYSLESLVWTIDAILSDQAWLQGLSELGEGLRRTLARLNRGGVYALAVQLAGILERCQLERPDWIQAWTSGTKVSQSVPWLGALWGRVVQSANGLAPLSLRLESFMAGLTPKSARSLGFSGLWVVAPTTLPPLVIRFLTALGDRGGVEVRFFHLVPAQTDSMWLALENEREDFDPELTPLGEQLAGAHPLLAAYARQSHDLGVLLAELGDGGTRPIDLDQILDRPFIKNASLLQQIQTQVHNAAQGPLHLADDDRSVSVHRCHSPLREVEVLRDALVETLCRSCAPRPDEVLIAVTDLDTYAPLITAILGEQRGDGLHFPVQVVGTSALTDPLLEAMLAVFALPGKPATLEQVLAPLEVPAIRRRFGLQEDDAEMVCHRLQSAGVSWGLDAQQRALVSGYDSDQGSWLLGIDRLLLGLATGPEASVLPELFPAGSALLGEAQALGGIAVYLRVLRTFAASVGDGTLQKSVPAWRSLLFGCINDLCDPISGPELKSLSLLRGAIAAIPPTAADLDLSVLRKHLGRMLGDDGNASTWSRGGITVAPLSTLRHVPCAFIAVLGLDSSFPRVQAHSVFDPMVSQRRRGDRSQRLDDRQNFLDLVLAARSRLHLSWTGHAAEDGSPREPSSVIEDFLRFLDPQISRSRILVEHRLHGTDPAYFDGTLPRSYDPLACQAAVARQQRRPGAAETPFLRSERNAATLPAVFSPQEVITWTTDPAQAFAKQVLGLKFVSEEVLPEHEPIQLAGLEAWELRDRLLEASLCEQPPNEARLRQDGILPHGPLGTLTLNEIGKEAEEIVTTLNAVLGKHAVQAREILAARWPVDVPLSPGHRISGQVSGCNGKLALCLHSGKLRGKHLLSAWILHQMLGAAAREGGRPGISTVLIGRGKEQKKEQKAKKTTKKPKVEKPLESGRVGFRAQDASVQAWEAITQALCQSFVRPLPIFPDLAAMCWDWSGEEGCKIEELAKHLDSWRLGADEEMNQGSEIGSPKPWTRLMWRGIDNPTQDWKQHFLEPLWIPALSAAVIFEDTP